VTGASQPVQTSDALPSLEFPASVGKGEYNLALTDAVYIDARAGTYFSDGIVGSKSTAPRIADVGANTSVAEPWRLNGTSLARRSMGP
jgi:hypothetical protein